MDDMMTKVLSNECQSRMNVELDKSSVGVKSIVQV